MSGSATCAAPGDSKPQTTTSKQFIGHWTIPQDSAYLSSTSLGPENNSQYRQSHRQHSFTDTSADPVQNPFSPPCQPALIGSSHETQANPISLYVQEHTSVRPSSLPPEMPEGPEQCLCDAEPPHQGRKWHGDLEAGLPIRSTHRGPSASNQINPYAQDLAPTKGFKLGSFPPDLPSLFLAEITQPRMTRSPQQPRAHTEDRPESKLGDDAPTLKQDHPSSEMDGATTLDMKDKRMLCDERQATLKRVYQDLVDLPSSPMTNGKCPVVPSWSVQDACASRNSSLTSFTEEDTESGDEDIAGSLQDLHFSDFSTISNEGLLSQGRTKDTLTRPVLSPMKQELVDRIMNEFWAIFDQRTPLMQPELPQSPMGDTNMNTESDDECNYYNKSNSKYKWRHILPRPLGENTNMKIKPDSEYNHHNMPNAKYDWAIHLPKMISLYYSGISVPEICKGIQDEETGFTPG
jgi:hypothetical protein